MEAEILARIQFALTAGFHFLFPPMSIGLAVILVFMEWKYLKTKNPLYEKLTLFWTRIFALTFAVGVATGIVLEFEFGTNWATYSRYVGDIFGSPLAAEGLFAFFLESTFLGILLFGWKRVGPKMHFFSTLMVALGSMMSAFWIIVANSWMHTPAGFEIVGEGLAARAEITDFWAMVFNPSAVNRFLHVIVASWMTGAFMMLSISAYYILKKVHLDFAKTSMKFALVLALSTSVLQLFIGHGSAQGMAEYQPVKLAACEGHFETGPADLYLFGWVDEETKETKGIAIPGMLSFLVSFDFEEPVTGLNDYADDLEPPLQITFQMYHIMIALGMTMIGLTLLAAFLWWRGKLFDNKWLMKILLISFIFPQAANQAGWIFTEVGRQPWVVQDLLKTSDAISKSVVAEQILFSIILFSVIYMALLALFVFILIKKVKAGPEAPELVALLENHK